jgi:glutaminyl-peptide cyclotransferase
MELPGRNTWSHAISHSITRRTAIGAVLLGLGSHADVAGKRKRCKRRSRPGNGHVPVFGYRIVTTYPHDRSAFTQGLVYRSGVLYEGTGLYGQSTLRRVDLSTGAVREKVTLGSAYFGEGIAVLKDRIYQLTWREQTGFVYDRETFALLDRFSYATEGWGLTTDGTRLMASNGTDRITFHDPDTFAELDSIAVRADGEPVPRLNELEYVKGEIWANVFQTDRIARIDRTTGKVSGWINLSGLLSDNDRAGLDVGVLNGIAYDAAKNRLFVTGKNWPKLFEITLRCRGGDQP